MPSVDEVGAFPVWNSNCFPGREGYKPKFIILHGTAGGTSAAAIGAFFQSTQGSANPVSAHYVIGQDGMVAQCNKESDGAWANGVITEGHDPWWDGSVNPNNVTISIEHCKPSSDNSNELTDAQKRASFKLVQHLCDRHGIPKRAADTSGGITGHYSLDPVNRSRCPGPYPWDELYAFLGGTSMGVPQGWSDNGTILVAPNGHKVVSGFRAHILANDWGATNVPLEEEHGVPGVPGTRQIFLYSALQWDNSGGVRPAPLGWWYVNKPAQPANIGQAVNALHTALSALGAQ